MTLAEARAEYRMLGTKLNKGGLLREERRHTKALRRELLDEFGSLIRAPARRAPRHFTLRKPTKERMLVVLLRSDGEPYRIIEVPIRGGLWGGSGRWPKLRHEAAAGALRQVALEIEKG